MKPCCKKAIIQTWDSSNAPNQSPYPTPISFRLLSPVDSPRRSLIVLAKLLKPSVTNKCRKKKLDSLRTEHTESLIRNTHLMNLIIVAVSLMYFITIFYNKLSINVCDRFVRPFTVQCVCISLDILIQIIFI